MNQERISIENSLRTVLDPEAGINVMDLGLIYNLEVDGGSVRITMTLTSAGCPVGPMIVEDVQSTLEAALPDRQILISLVFDPPWTPERITEEGKRLLEL
ncbi:MAG: metal-sulfur cluster assembly factor [Leptospiraceae bacterium]|nr:metal-sulfur cluster assembly factor [Leptospiraceae bacterium]MCB1169862.1 metal-sulfur cluster assembly factor [Leptospiraceae bacterium]